MQMQQTLTMKPLQTLRMTSQIIQSIELLQLPRMELLAHINQQLIENPVLEVVEEGEENLPAEGEPPAGESGEEPETPDGADLYDAELHEPRTAEEKHRQELERLEEWTREEEFPENHPPRRYADDEDGKMEAMQTAAAPTETLQEALLSQLAWAKESERLKENARLVIGNIDEAGYLRLPLMDCFRMAVPEFTAYLEGVRRNRLSQAGTRLAEARGPLLTQLLGVKEEQELHELEGGELLARASKALDGTGEGLAGAEQLRQELQRARQEAEAQAGLVARAERREALATLLELSDQELEELEGREIFSRAQVACTARPAQTIQLSDPPVTEEEALEALWLVQSFDPPGVGARDLKECLRLQLQREPGDASFVQLLVEQHFDDLAANRLPKVAKETGSSLERVKKALEAISRLNPKPGLLYGSALPHYIVPDAAVEELDGEYVIRLNDGDLPELRISRQYQRLLQDEKRGSELRDYIRQKIQAARWLKESIAQRRNTLLKITQQIVELQRDFFDKGVAHLKPLMMQEVADRINMHVSTVSRALAEKYLQTPVGVFPMKYFFTGGFRTADGAEESNRTIMQKIKELCEGEDKSNPLSDHEIVKKMMADHGIKIARRTVAKYREKLKIPSSRQRKEY